MIPEDSHVRSAFVPTPGTLARLHLDGQEVGTIIVNGHDAAWTYGAFSPGEGFGPFASLFGRWSLLMHEDEDLPLHPTAQEALSEAERSMDTLHARLYYPQRDCWQRVAQINIDGTDVEWREG